MPLSVSGRSLTAAALLSAFALVGCDRPAEPPPPQDRLTVTPVTFAQLPGWADDRVSEAVTALRRSCPRLLAQPADRPLGPEGRFGTPAAWKPACDRLAALPVGDDGTTRAFFEGYFVPHALANNAEREGLFTGYYEIELNGSRSPDPAFPTPIYRRPPDLVMVDLGEFSDKWKGERTAGRVVNGRLKPYEDRAAIDGGALAGKGLELLWAADPIAVFFLHIQGSGRVSLPDGSEVRVGYAGQNGHRYVAIGRELIDRGALKREEVSLQTIRAWLKANPAEAAAVMNTNPSYVFFEELKGEGPVGGQGVALTPGRSLAVDRSFVPYGMPLWLDAEDPVDPARRLQRLMVAQDTGGAIRGPVRGDVFWGHGADAELRAGVMKSKGSYYVLLPRTVEMTPKT